MQLESLFDHSHHVLVRPDRSLARVVDLPVEACEHIRTLEIEIPSVRRNSPAFDRLAQGINAQLAVLRLASNLQQLSVSVKAYHHLLYCSSEELAATLDSLGQVLSELARVVTCHARTPYIRLFCASLWEYEYGIQESMPYVGAMILVNALQPLVKLPIRELHMGTLVDDVPSERMAYELHQVMCQMAPGVRKLSLVDASWFASARPPLGFSQLEQVDLLGGVYMSSRAVEDTISAFPAFMNDSKDTLQHASVLLDSELESFHPEHPEVFCCPRLESLHLGGMALLNLPQSIRFLPIRLLTFTLGYTHDWAALEDLLSPSFPFPNLKYVYFQWSPESDEWDRDVALFARIARILQERAVGIRFSIVGKESCAFNFDEFEGWLRVVADYLVSVEITFWPATMGGPRSSAGINLPRLESLTFCADDEGGENYALVHLRLLDHLFDMIRAPALQTITLYITTSTLDYLGKFQGAITDGRFPGLRRITGKYKLRPNEIAPNVEKVPQAKQDFLDTLAERGVSLRDLRWMRPTAPIKGQRTAPGSAQPQFDALVLEKDVRYQTDVLDYVDLVGALTLQ